MKKVILFLALLTCPLLAVAQKGISYQAVILDPKPIKIPGQDITGQPFVNGEVSLKFKLFSSTFVQEFEEVHVAKTDAYGLVNVLIGSVSPGAFASLVWDSNPKNMQVWVSFDQGGTYNKVSEQVLSYNPYALYAETTGTAGKLSGTLTIAEGGTGAKTAANARTNLGLGNVDNTADAAKPISTATQAALDTKANANDVTTALATKANAAEVATALGTKANESEVTTRLATKANASEVTTALATKANANEVSTALASKASAEEVATALATKANASDVTTSLATKANTDEVITALATKANANEVTTALATKASAAEVTSALATKANASDVSTSLALKEDVSNKANTPLGSSTTFYPTQNAVKTYVDAQVAAATIGDANGSTKGKIQLAGDLAGTAAAPTVPGLALKANTTDVNSSLALKAPIASPSFTGSVAVGTASPSASAVLDINSTSQGILVPRMTTVQRDAIASPANTLFIFNTSNNRFEVFKSTCSCWIAITDGGSGVYVAPANTMPSINNLNYTGLFRVGGNPSINYTYSDADKDAEGATTILWEIANDNNGTARTTHTTGASPTFVTADAGRYVRVKVTPRAATGVLNGIDNYGSWTLIDAASVPYGSAVSVTGTAEQGSLLTASYTFNGGSGTENALGSTYTWQSATSIKGANTATLSIPDGGTAFSKTIRPTINEVNKYIRFGVRAKDNGSVTAASFVYSDWVGPVNLAGEAAPLATNVSYSPAPGTSVELKATYTFVDANNDPEGTSLYQWYTATDASGANQEAISGAITKSFTPTAAQAGKYIGFGITPKASTGTTTGAEVVYYSTTPSVAAAGFTIVSVTQSSSNFYINRVMDATDLITVRINVSSAGAIAFSTPIVNGYSFSNGGVYPTGAQDVILYAKGTQTAYNAAGDIFTITAVGSSTQTSTITISNTSIVTALANNAPTVSNIIYKGVYRTNGTASVVYTYADAEKDAEAATTINWEIADDGNGTAKTTYSTNATPTFTALDGGKYVRVKITPRAATGILNGVDYYEGWTIVDAALKPYATTVNVTGKTEQGSTLTGSYTYNGGTNGATTYTESTLGSTYQWQTASNNKGAGISNMTVPDGGIAFGKTIRLTINDVNKYVRFGVQAKDNLSNSSSYYEYSDWVGPITLAAEAAPVAKNVSYSPAPGTNITAKASYTYEDANNDPEGATLYRWYTADDATGTNQTAIAGATAATIPLTNAQANKFIGVGITPVAATGTKTGTEVIYYSPAASIGLASFTITDATQKSNNFYTNRVMDATDKISVNINVTTGGAISFSTTTVNGYTFSKSGTYAVGVHNVLLTGTGTQTAFNTGGDAFTITGVGATTQTATLTVNNVKIGADFTTHYNGISAGISSNFLLATYTTGETFNNNSTCFSKPISTSACVGTTITIGSNTYSIATINGQCWMTQNINELPNGVAITANQWLATSPGDQGFYGYFNTVTTGASGWATTEPAAKVGLLYQWSAAMLGSTTERAQGICPAGWHIPSDCEWMYLEHGQGMSLGVQTLSGLRADDADNKGTPGFKLRSAGTGQTNASGFSVLLYGYRVSDGTFVPNGGYNAFWTSSAASATNASLRYLASGQRGVGRGSDNKSLALYVRCLKD
jgi:uncharacterized protein (TIGR02145 family)